MICDDLRPAQKLSKLVLTLCNDFGRILTWPLSTGPCRFCGLLAEAWKSFQRNFGVYGCVARLLFSPSYSQNCRKKQQILKNDTFILCAKPCYWESRKPLHLKPGHLKMAFFSARCLFDGAWGIALDRARGWPRYCR